MRRAFWLGNLLLVGLVISPEMAWSAGRMVPAIRTSLQAAIDAAGTGDRIRIATGSYDGPLVIRGKHLVLEGDGPGIAQVTAAVNPGGRGRTASPWPSPRF